MTIFALLGNYSANISVSSPPSPVWQSINPLKSATGHLDEFRYVNKNCVKLQIK